MNIRINHKSETPIYRQIVEYIESEAKSGNLDPESKLPTFRSLSEDLKVSLGTVKRAYDELYRNGIITMTQGRGSFISPNANPNIHSKKEAALELIDETIEKLTKLNFSNQEIRIFWDLKMREMESENYYIKVAIIDCSIEALIMIESKVSKISNIDIQLFLLEDFINKSKVVPREEDLYITTFTHYNEVNDRLKDEEKLMGIVMTPSFQTVVQISKLKETDKIGVVTSSKIFAGIINKACNQFSEFKEILPVFYLRTNEDLQNYMNNYDKFILPNNFHRIASQNEIEVIRKAKQSGKEIILYDYETDDGSFAYLSERIEALVKKKNM